jgi:UTP--glucose-1-phosphate uridylyltransferase
VQDIADLADIHYVRQKDRNGLGDAVLYARKHVGDESFALLLGDTIIKTNPPCTDTLISHAEEHSCSVLSLERVPWSEVSKYGVAEMVETSESDSSFPVDDFVEKPPQDAAPSNLAITGRYIFTPEIFDRLEETELGVGGELQLTDAIRKLEEVRGVELEGSRYDIGNIPSWLQANLEMALNHDDGNMNAAVQALIEEYS